MKLYNDRGNLGKVLAMAQSLQAHTESWLSLVFLILSSSHLEVITLIAHLIVAAMHVTSRTGLC